MGCRFQACPIEALDTGSYATDHIASKNFEGTDTSGTQ